MRSFHRRLFPLACVALAWAPACKQTTLSLEGLVCGDDGQCLDGYVCNPISGICVQEVEVGCENDSQICPTNVTPGGSCPAEGVFVPCTEGGDPHCADGCYVCQADSTWSECQTAGRECAPNSVTCDGSRLVVCTSSGTIDETLSMDCGDLGCNDSVAPAHCNECAPSTQSCDGIILEICGSDGTIVSTQDCTTPNDCSGVGACDPVLGCTTVTAPDGSPCDEDGGQDGDMCNSACVSGVCTAGTAVTCADSNICTDDSCDTTLGCVFVNNTAPCDDGEICTVNDACAGGTCVAGDMDPCDDSNVCTTDSCTLGVGCSNVDNTATCDDGDPCTTVDACSAGTCVGSVPATCDDFNPCTDDSCQIGAGCQHSNNTDPCDDNDACTTADACSGGTCIGGAAPNCNDGNVCTDDSCDAVTGCQNINNTAACDDGDPCTLIDACSGGTCNGSTIDTCDDSDDCTTDSCIAGTGCSNVWICDCTGPGDCADGNPCTDDVCDPSFTCQNPPNSNPCDDNNACTTVDVCSGGICTGSVPPECDDSNICTNDSCVPATGCVNVDNTDPCDDSNACTTVDVCSGGICTGSAPLDCDDSNICTDDTCDAALGCQNTNNTDPCNDSNACTTADTCSGGTCVGGPPPDCNDSNICTDDSCDTALGCQTTNNTGPCDDNNACTTVDICSGGACTGSVPPDCDDSNICTNDSCVPATGCVNVDNTDPCDDSNACTTVDLCSGGICTGSAPLDCDDSNICTDDTCDAILGCQTTNNTGPCNDGNACTDPDACSGGLCVPGGAVSCDDSQQCTTDSCNTTLGCQYANVGNGTPCSDCPAGPPCDGCLNGVCQDPSGCTGTDTVTVSGVATPACNQGASNIEALHIIVRSTCDNTLTAITLTRHASSNTDVADIENIRLFDDSDSSGGLSGGDTQVGGPVSMTATGAITFTGLSISLPASTDVHLFLAVDRGSAGKDSYFAVSLAAASDFSVADTGGTSQVGVPAPASGAHSLAARFCTGAGASEPTDLGTGTQAVAYAWNMRSDASEPDWDDGRIDDNHVDVFIDGDDDGSETTDCDLETGGWSTGSVTGRLQTRDRGRRSEYLAIDTGVPLGLPLCSLQMRVWASQFNFAWCEDDRLQDHSTIWTYSYDGVTSGSVNSTTREILAVSAQNGPATANEGCTSDYATFDIKSLYDNAAGTTNLKVRFIPEVEPGDVPADTIDDNGGTRIRTIAEIYILAGP